MAKSKQVELVEAAEEVKIIEAARGFWAKNSKRIMVVGGALIVLLGGYLAYKNFYKAPQEIKANEVIFKAQEYFSQDSLDLALNGDGVNPGFLKIISRYGGTVSANLAEYYTGSIYLKKKDYPNAIKHLKAFSSESRPVMARTFSMLGDAYAQTGKKAEAADAYKKAGTYFPEDQANSAEYLKKAGNMYELLNKEKEAIEVYKIIKEKCANSNIAITEVDKFLARLGVLDAEIK